MTYSDPNNPQSSDPMNPQPERPAGPTRRSADYGIWLLGGILGAILIVGVAFIMSRNTTATPTNTTRPAPTTTGSGSVPLPGSGQGTAGNPIQTVPPP
jgi:hypothetical protein